MPHDDFWSAIEKRIAAAEFFLREMSKDIVPPSEPHLAAIRMTGVVVNHPWQERFYPHFDAFLAMTRSVPEIIRCLFGNDRTRRLNVWRKGLIREELVRREKFQSQFENACRAFVAMPLSDARDVTLHRAGVAPVEVHVVGPWGTAYVGTPLVGIPQSESLPISAENDPALLWIGMQPFPSIEPRQTDFSLVIASGGTSSNVPLFPACQRFLEAARKLVADAQRISQATHGSAPLTPPSV